MNREAQIELNPSVSRIEKSSLYEDVINKDLKELTRRIQDIEVSVIGLIRVINLMEFLTYSGNQQNKETALILAQECLLDIQQATKEIYIASNKLDEICPYRW